MPVSGEHALDIGARDGHFSKLMAERFNSVTALDLSEPSISHPKIQCVAGNAAALQFADSTFDFVFCAEVFEHIPTTLLANACQEIERVSNNRILIGVPYKQDIRVGWTTCYSCGKQNPPWGHVNAFDEQTIANLFRRSEVDTILFGGISRSQTNWMAAALMDFAGNPYGTYEQEETCIHCNNRLIPPPPRTPAQLIATRCALWLRKTTSLFARPRGNWMHVVLRKLNAVQ